MANHVQDILESMVGPAALLIFGAIAKYLRDISMDVSTLKSNFAVSIAVINERLNQHDSHLRDLDEKL